MNLGCCLGPFSILCHRISLQRALISLTGNSPDSALRTEYFMPLGVTFQRLEVWYGWQWSQTGLVVLTQHGVQIQETKSGDRWHSLGLGPWSGWGSLPDWTSHLETKNFFRKDKVFKSSPVYTFSRERWHDLGHGPWASWVFLWSWREVPSWCWKPKQPDNFWNQQTQDASQINIALPVRLLFLGSSLVTSTHTAYLTQNTHLSTQRLRYIPHTQDKQAQLSNFT